jgi:hypothetical protein
VSEKYSLEALRTLRRAREEALDSELLERGRELDQRTRDVRQEAGVLERLGAERREGRELEGELLANSGMSAGDLVQGFEHQSAQASREELQRARLRASEAERQRAHQERERVVARLRTARAEREAVERHHERWKGEQTRKAEESEDESATERWSGQHFGPGRS